MKIITEKNTNIIVSKCSLGILNENENTIEIEENSFIGNANLYNLYEVSEDFEGELLKNTYDGTVVGVNPNYTVPLLTTEEKIKALEEQNKMLESAILDLANIVGGGV